MLTVWNLGYLFDFTEIKKLETEVRFCFVYKARNKTKGIPGGGDPKIQL